MSNEIEFSASEIRQILQAFFPHRRLVLSQFTFFNQAGVAKPTGETYRRGRRCYRLEDILPIACILALKEEGIPLKNIETVPEVLQINSRRIFDSGAGCRLSGFGDQVCLNFPGEISDEGPLRSFLSTDSSPMLFWGFDVGALAVQLRQVVDQYLAGELQKAA